MKIVPKFSAEKNKNQKVILKNLEKRKDFFNKYIENYTKVNSCPICNNSDCEDVVDQYRHFLFSDFSEDNKNLKTYFNNIRFQLNNEKLVICRNCGLIFSNSNYDYNFFLEYMQIHDGTDPLHYDENLLAVDKYYSLAKHNARMKKILSLAKNVNQKKLKFLEVSSYRSWALDKSNILFDAYGIEPHSDSVKFSNHKFYIYQKK